MIHVRARARVFVAGALALCAGCATVHHSPASPRIQFGVDGGFYYLKNDQRTPIGLLGGDLPSLVAPDDEAIQFARRGRRELAIGVPTYLAGVAAIVIGAAVAKPPGWAVAGGGLAVVGVGASLMGAGAVNLIDAVHTYNDHVAPGLP
jgi:hypothetical protein